MDRDETSVEYSVNLQKEGHTAWRKSTPPTVVAP